MALHRLDPCAETGLFREFQGGILWMMFVETRFIASHIIITRLASSHRIANADILASRIVNSGEQGEINTLLRIANPLFIAGGLQIRHNWGLYKTTPLRHQPPRTALPHKELIPYRANKAHR